MAAISKPINQAFVVSDNKVQAFLDKKAYKSSDAIKRIEDRKAKADKVASKNNK